MKIAVVAPVLRPVPPVRYGGIEAIIDWICEAAAEAGNEVVLYAPFGSYATHPKTEVRLTTTSDLVGSPDRIRAAELALFQRVVRDQAEFDVIHSHIEPIVAAYEDGNYYFEINTPLVVTFHNHTYIDKHIAYYKSVVSQGRINHVFISQNQMKPLNFLPDRSVIYNGIDLSKMPFSPRPGQYLAFLGRFTPEKGIVEAIEIASKAGWPLKIAAAIDPSQQEYYEQKIKPLIHSGIEYIGEIAQEDKGAFISGARALLFPIRWEEPFGLVMVEAMACGTPVIGTRIGSVPEVIEDGRTGFVVGLEQIITEGVAALEHVGQIDRQVCRERVERLFSRDVMTAKYLDLYESVAGSN